MQKTHVMADKERSEIVNKAQHNLLCHQSQTLSQSRVFRDTILFNLGHFNLQNNPAFYIFA